MKITVLLLLLTVCEGSSNSTVVGQVGHNITLPCTYDIKHYGSLWMCWGQGQIPNSGCNKQLIATNGEAVTDRASTRYQLLGRLDQGDVSLTILNVTEADSGQYGCRVQIPGPFNDQKHQIQVIVETAVQTTTATTKGAQTATEQTTANHTTAQLTSTESHTTSFQSSSTEAMQDSKLTMALVCGVFAVIAVLTVVGLVIITRRMLKHWKSPRWLDNQLHFTSSSSTLQLQRQSSVVDNVYQVYSAEDDGGVYESPP
ncbi:hepatitis A virus cellular receptor 2 homolog isoform X2 [Nelusetta ayraudi]|uniref:hepatitis A virus cellular receptor 2 homolog isoform X2 n=1 Tax=Nelusetta ayraudi TaxID=303726 RepID=UPI003F6FCC99